MFGSLEDPNSGIDVLWLDVYIDNVCTFPAVATPPDLRAGDGGQSCLVPQ